jgi:hypothetical protein
MQEPRLRSQEGGRVSNARKDKETIREHQRELWRQHGIYDFPQANMGDLSNVGQQVNM